MPRVDGATPFQESLKWDYKHISEHVDFNLLQYVWQLLVRVNSRLLAFISFGICPLHLFYKKARHRFSNKGTIKKEHMLKFQNDLIHSNRHENPCCINIYVE